MAIDRDRRGNQRGEHPPLVSTMPVQDRDRDEQHQRRRDQQGELLPVDLEDSLEDASRVQLGVHAGECTPCRRRSGVSS